MHGFQDNGVLLPTGYDDIISPLLGGASGDFFMTNSERATMTSSYWSIVTFYVLCMVSEITRFYCKLDMTSWWFLRQGTPQAIFHDGFWKSDNDFLIAFRSNFLSGMHGFRDNEVLLQAGYDVIVNSPLGGAPSDFSWRILKERPWLPDSDP